MFLAGVPTKTELAGKLFNTTELAPIIQLSPIVTSPNTIEPAYITTLLPNLGRPPFLSPRVKFWWIKQLSPMTLLAPITLPGHDLFAVPYLLLSYKIFLFAPSLALQMHISASFFKR